MRSPLAVGLAASLALAACGAEAGERPAHGSFGHHRGYGYPAGFGYGGYGFADGAVSGAYIGAPLTRFPGPSAIVPPAWGYGTYGVPTMTGIRQAPVGDPKVYVVHGAGPSARRSRAGSWADMSAEAAPGDPRIVSVTVPRR